jgi:hypothetical protein
MQLKLVKYSDARDKMEKLTQEKLSQKKFKLGEIVWYMLAELVAVRGRIVSSYICEEKYIILVYSECTLSIKHFEVTDKEIAKTKEELMERYEAHWLHP